MSEEFDGYHPSYFEESGDNAHNYAAVDKNKIIDDDDDDYVDSSIITTTNNNNNNKNRLRVGKHHHDNGKYAYEKLIGTGVFTNGKDTPPPPQLPPNHGIISRFSANAKAFASHCFDKLDPADQCKVGNPLPAEAMLAFLTDELVERLKLNSVDDVENLSIKDIILSGVLPIVVSLTKRFGPWSMSNRLGGARSSYTNASMDNPTLVQYNLAAIIKHDSSWDREWGWGEISTIPVHPHSEAKLKELRDVAQTMIGNSVGDTYNVYDGQNPNVLLKRVEGMKELQAVVGGMKQLTETGVDITTAELRTCINDAGGSLNHRKIGREPNATAFILTLALGRDDDPLPGEGADARFEEIKRMVKAHEGTGNKTDFYWELYSEKPDEENQSKPLETGSKFSARSGWSLLVAMNKRSAEAGPLKETRYRRHWKKGSGPNDEVIKADMSAKTWANYAVDGWLYNYEAKLWVRCV